MTRLMSLASSSCSVRTRPLMRSSSSRRAFCVLRSPCASEYQSFLTVADLKCADSCHFHDPSYSSLPGVTRPRLRSRSHLWFWVRHSRPCAFCCKVSCDLCRARARRRSHFVNALLASQQYYPWRARLLITPWRHRERRALCSVSSTLRPRHLWQSGRGYSPDCWNRSQIR